MKYTGKDGSLRIYNMLYGYIEVHFSNMDFSGPIGRPKREEILVLDRGNVDKYGHYINSGDQVVFDPTPISFSCFVDDITHVNTTNGFKEVLVEALNCRDARNDETDNTWTGWGVSTKGFSKIHGNLTPRFTYPQRQITAGSVNSIQGGGTILIGTNTWGLGEAGNCLFRFTSGNAAGKYLEAASSNGSAVNFAPLNNLTTEGVVIGDTYEVYDNIRCVDVEFKLNSPAGNDIVWGYRETYFPLDECTITESEDSVNMACTGGVYGRIFRASDWVTPVIE